ncbi:MAG TPA: hypothetical protein VKF62_13265, partial [Planctomycetota bacterium]|nr:hypothetical protein [Planctomycetota bacterium]
VLAHYSFRGGGFPRFFVLFLAGFAATTSLFLAVVFPRFDETKSAAPLARELLRVHRGEPVYCLRVPPEGLRYYSGIPAVDIQGDEAFLQRLSGVFPALGVTTEGAYRKLRPKLPEGIEVLAGDTFAHRETVVLGRPRP